MHLFVCVRAYVRLFACVFEGMGVTRLWYAHGHFRNTSKYAHTYPSLLRTLQTHTHTRQRQIVYRGVAHAQSIPSLREPLADTHHRGAHAGQERLFAPATPVGVSLLELEVTMVASLCDYEVTG